MKLKKKLCIAIIIGIGILLILPLILVNLSKPHEFMGIMMLLFFIINPITAVIINSMFGNNIKKVWYLPILFCLVFLLSYWLVLEEIILDLIVYAFIYFIIGIISMVISFFLTRKTK